MSRVARRRCIERGMLGALVGSALVAFVAGCGISLGAEGAESEIFRELTVPAQAAPGEEVALVIDYEQPYPVGVTIVCDIFSEGRELEEGERGAVILRRLLPENPQGGPLDETTPVPGMVEESFAAPGIPGEYTVRCLTEGDEENAVSESITVAQPVATPDVQSEGR